MFSGQLMSPPMPKFPEYVIDEYIWVLRFKDVNDKSKGTQLTKALVKGVYIDNQLFDAVIDMEGYKDAMIAYNGVIYSGHLTFTNPLQTTFDDIGFVMQILDRK